MKRESISQEDSLIKTAYELAAALRDDLEKRATEVNFLKHELAAAKQRIAVLENVLNSFPGINVVSVYPEKIIEWIKQLDDALCATPVKEEQDDKWEELFYSVPSVEELFKKLKSKYKLTKL